MIPVSRYVRALIACNEYPTVDASRDDWETKTEI